MNQNECTVQTSWSDPWAGDDHTLTLGDAHGDRTGMQDESKQIGKIARWFQESARPFLEKVQPDKVAGLDHDLAKLLAVEKLLPTESAVCFLGNSGVGKSTLINTLVGGSTVLLPSGGIGPLTAQAPTVRHGKEPRFEVQYHPFQNLWRLVFGLERSHRTELLPPGSDPNVPGAVPDTESPS